MELSPRLGGGSKDMNFQQKMSMAQNNSGKNKYQLNIGKPLFKPLVNTQQPFQPQIFQPKKIGDPRGLFHSISEPTSQQNCQVLDHQYTSDGKIDYRNGSPGMGLTLASTEFKPTNVNMNINT